MIGTNVWIRLLTTILLTMAPALAQSSNRLPVRKGSNEWTCLPAVPGDAHDEPGSFDHIFLQFMQDSLAGRMPDVRSVGISYMYVGKWVSNRSHAMGGGDEFHVGPHIMIIGLDQKMLQTLNQDGSNGQPYANHLPGRTELFLVIPNRQWDERDAHQ